MRYLIMIAFLAGLFGGWYVTADHYSAVQAETVRKAVEKYKAGVERGNSASGKLAQAETIIQIKTVERIKYVPQVTVGVPCLSPDAVGLLNGSGYPKLSEAARQPAAADAPALAASDTDVANWVAIANGQYETCAARLSGLIDYEEGTPP